MYFKNWTRETFRRLFGFVRLYSIWLEVCIKFLEHLIPLNSMTGGILFLSCLSACLSVVNFILHHNYWTMKDRDVIVCLNSPLIKPTQTLITSSVTLTVTFRLLSDFATWGGGDCVLHFRLSVHPSINILVNLVYLCVKVLELALQFGHTIFSRLLCSHGTWITFYFNKFDQEWNRITFYFNKFDQEWNRITFYFNKFIQEWNRITFHFNKFDQEWNLITFYFNKFDEEWNLITFHFNKFDQEWNRITFYFNKFDQEWNQITFYFNKFDQEWNLIFILTNLIKNEIELHFILTNLIKNEIELHFILTNLIKNEIELHFILTNLIKNEIEFVLACIDIVGAWKMLGVAWGNFWTLWILWRG